MTEANGSADSGLVVPVMSLHQVHAELEKVRVELADMERRCVIAEARVAELLKLGLEEPESPLGRRCVLELEMRSLGLRGGASTRS